MFSAALVLLPTLATLAPLPARAAATLVPLPAQAADVPWPTKEWPTGAPAGVDAAALDAALQVTAAARPGLGETRAVVLVQHGRLVAERYMPGYGPDMPLLSWSMAKSVTQALTGVAVRRGLVDIDKPMGNPRWAAGDRRAAITWRQWLNMVDGQEYWEIGVADQTKNDAAKMLFGSGRLDVAAYAAALPLTHEPGSHWNYNSAGINLIADALERVLLPGVTAPSERRQRMAALLRDELFAPLGMTTAEAEYDATGTFIGSAFVYASARDWARFGLLYLRDGMWDQKRILPAGWVDFARTKTTAADSDIYGAGWWVTPQSGSGRPRPALTPHGPRDLFTAQGHEGQLVVVVPSKDLVLVRLGHLSDVTGWAPLGQWVERVVALFPDR